MLVARRAIMGYTGETVLPARRTANQTKQVVNVRRTEGVYGEPIFLASFHIRLCSLTYFLIKIRQVWADLTIGQLTNTVPAFGMTTASSTPTPYWGHFKGAPNKGLFHTLNAECFFSLFRSLTGAKTFRPSLSSIISHLTLYGKTLLFIKAKLFGCSHPPSPDFISTLSCWKANVSRPTSHRSLADLQRCSLIFQPTSLTLGGKISLFFFKPQESHNLKRSKSKGLKDIRFFVPPSNWG